MKFTLSWLKDHLDTDAPLQRIADTLTMIGLEVEQVTDRGEALKPFTVAEILEAEKHPQADRLRVCKVNTGKDTRQIVCGAPNARAGLKVALANIGAVIPANGLVIKKTTIRGIESSGMLCSATELGLGTDSEGIIELPQDAEVGESIVGALGLDDPVIEIAVTPNRGDALGVRGIARDLAAAGVGTLKPYPHPTLLPGSPPSRGGEGTFPSPINVRIEDERRCPQFIGCYIKNVKNGESPAWIKRRLEAIGLRPISALVDITNYICITYARPLHVFDADKLKGNLTVRPAGKDNTLGALNDKSYVLFPQMTVIADEAGAQAIGGIIGGTSTGCTPETKNVFLEVALFDPVNIAETGRALEIQSDARYRFERGVDPVFVRDATLLAVGMIRELCGGEPSELVVAGKTPEWKRTITFNPSLVATLGGVAVEEQKSKAILEALGFEVYPHPNPLPQAGEGIWQVTPPSWRRDVEGAPDVVEEILRIHGYDHIPATPLPRHSAVAQSVLSPKQRRVSTARRLLASRGLTEICSWSFIPQRHAERFGGGTDALRLLNPISAELDAMRPSLLPNLLAAASRNRNRFFHDLALFEVGEQFSDPTPNGQRTVAAGIRVGTQEDFAYPYRNFSGTCRPVDTFDAKADALALLAALGLTGDKLEVGGTFPTWYHPSRSGPLTLGGKVMLGYFGEIHPAVAEQFDLIGVPIAAFEIMLDAIPLPRAKGKAKPPLAVSDYQPVTRDFAFILGQEVTAQELTRTLAKAEKSLVKSLRVFDVYSGKGIDAGKKSIAVTVTLQAPDRTLTDAEIEQVSTTLVKAAAETFGATLRQ